MEITNPAEIIRKIKGSRNIIMPGGCANAASFYDEFVKSIGEFSNLEILSGLSLGKYPYLSEGLNTIFKYSTWQAGMGLRNYFNENTRRVDLIPLRLGDLTKVVGRKQAIEPDVVVVQASLPQKDGSINLGLSVGPNPHFINQANVVVAELNHNMPVTFGDSAIDIGQIDFAYESDSDLLIYDTGVGEERDSEIVNNVLDLIPEGATVQVGIGGIPDRITEKLALINGVSIFTGIISNGLLSFIEATNGTSKVVTGEIAGNHPPLSRNS